MSEKKTTTEEEFASTTSCHGISHVFQYEAGSLPRMVWIILTIAAASVCISQCIVTIYEASLLPTRITFSDASSYSAIFPSVTICNTDNSPRDAVPVDDLKYMAILLNAQSRENAYTSSQISEAANYFLNKYGDTFDYENYIRTSNVKLTDMLLSCQWMSRPCNVSDFKSVITDYGSCYTFNPGTDDIPLKNQTVPGEHYGLRLILNVEQYRYYPNLLDTSRADAGVRFTIHYHREPPDLLAKSIVAPAGSHTYASITQTYRKRLKKPWGECGERKLYFHQFYSHTACIDEVAAIFAIDECNCSIIGAFDSFKECNSVQFLTCIAPILAKVRILANKNTANCPLPCETYTYPTLVSYGKLATIPFSSVISEGLNLNVSAIINRTQSLGWIKDPNYSISNFIADNIVYLDIYYSDLQTNAIEQMRATGFAEVLSNIGGQLGLFIGASVLTMVEILQYLLKKLCNRSITKSIPSQNEPEKTGGTTAV